MKNAIFNPNNLPIKDLPFIYGFNNGGNPGMLSGVLLAEDGTGMGGHLCSEEGFMYGDLGILDGTRPDRHESFKKHYPNGYRMKFICDPTNHTGLMLAYERNQENAKNKTFEEI